jgi:uncharacterized membrane protein YcaP (DUF421 family)
MAASYNSITAGFVLIGTLIFWAYAIDWLGYRFPFVQQYVHPPKKALIRDGKIVRRAMEQELMSDEELMTQLRLSGTEDVAEVRAAYIEGNGQVSVLKRDSKGDDGRKPSESALVGG